MGCYPVHRYAFHPHACKVGDQLDQLCMSCCRSVKQGDSTGRLHGQGAGSGLRPHQDDATRSHLPNAACFLAITPLSTGYPPFECKALVGHANFAFTRLFLCIVRTRSVVSPNSLVCINSEWCCTRWQPVEVSPEARL